MSKLSTLESTNVSFKSSAIGYEGNIGLWCQFQNFLQFLQFGDLVVCVVDISVCCQTKRPSGPQGAAQACLHEGQGDAGVANDEAGYETSLWCVDDFTFIVCHKYRHCSIALQ